MRVRLGQYGKKVLYFDGIDDYVEIPHNDTQNFDYITIEALIKFDKPDPTYWGHHVARKQDVFAVGTGPHDKVYMAGWVHVNGSWHGTWDGGPPDIAYKWVHLVWRFDGNKFDWILNTNVIRTVYVSGVLDKYPNPIMIGTGTQPGFEPGKGIIALLRIWNRALNDYEIRLVYHDAFNLAPTRVRNGLVLELIPDTIDYANGVWRDNSGNGNDGTIYGCKLIHV